MAKFLLPIGCFLALSAFVLASPVSHPGSEIFDGHYQGDIKLTEVQKKYIEDVANGIAPSTGLLDTTRRWRRNLAGDIEIPYLFNATAGFTANQFNFMRTQFKWIEDKTCIRFVERTTEIDWVDIINGSGCWSFLGRIGGRQEVSMIRPGCFWGGTFAHEMMHVIGFDHMHNDVNRDEYVEIMWDNINPRSRFNFNLGDPLRVTNFNTPYDYRSALHYPRWAFADGGLDAIVPRDSDYLDVIGSSTMSEISDGDAMRINRMHECILQ